MGGLRKFRRSISRSLRIENNLRIDINMAGLFDKQAGLYLDARPDYPNEWYSWLASRTLRHSLAWDVGTGNGQAAIAVAGHYEQVIATDVSKPQLDRAIPHPRVKYLQTLPSMSEEQIVSTIGGEASVDLITVAQAVHWFDLPSFYAGAARLLRKPGGVLAVWCYNDIVVDPEFDSIMKRWQATTLPYWHPNVRHCLEGYKTLRFPFEPVGLGSEGEPLELEIPKTMSFEGFLGVVGSWSAVVTARGRGVELLGEKAVKELERGWGGAGVVRSVAYKAYMLAGKVRL